MAMNYATIVPNILFFDLGTFFLAYFPYKHEVPHAKIQAICSLPESTHSKLNKKL